MRLPKSRRAPAARVQAPRVIRKSSRTRSRPARPISAASPGSRTSSSMRAATPLVPPEEAVDAVAHHERNPAPRAADYRRALPQRLAGRARSPRRASARDHTSQPLQRPQLEGAEALVAGEEQHAAARRGSPRPPWRPATPRPPPRAAASTSRSSGSPAGRGRKPSSAAWGSSQRSSPSACRRRGVRGRRQRPHNGARAALPRGRCCAARAVDPGVRDGEPPVPEARVAQSSRAGTSVSRQRS